MRAYRISLPRDAEELAVALLWQVGTEGIQIESGEDEATSRLLAYFSHELDAAAVLARLPGAEIRQTEVPQVDWVARFREGFTAFRVDDFTIAPAWGNERPDARTLLVEPGRAFGTGTHETTRLCLAAVAHLARAGPLGRLLDLGAGTGLLALAAVRLGARTAVALDLDPEATAAARRHAALNAQRLLVLRGDGGRPLRPGCFDTVVANLTMPLLVERAAEIAALAHPAGRHVLSGFLATDAPAIEAAWPVPARIERRSEGEWGALVLTGLDR